MTVSAPSRSCSLCTKAIDPTFEGVCGRCEGSMCRACNTEGNECKDCVDEAQDAHELHLAQAEHWASLSDAQREAAIHAPLY